MLEGVLRAAPFLCIHRALLALGFETLVAVFARRNLTVDMCVASEIV